MPAGIEVVPGDDVVHALAEAPDRQDDERDDYDRDEDDDAAMSSSSMMIRSRIIIAASDIIGRSVASQIACHTATS